jgi:flagellar protein FlaG
VSPTPVAGSADAGPKAPAQVSAEQIQQAARQLQQYLQQTGRTMEHSVDHVTGMTIVRIYSSASGELVRQIPTEEIVHLAEVLREESRHSTLDVMA